MGRSGSTPSRAASLRGEDQGEHARALQRAHLPQAPALVRKRQRRTVWVLARGLALHPEGGRVGFRLLVEGEVRLSLLEVGLERELLAWPLALPGRLRGLRLMRHGECGR